MKEEVNCKDNLKQKESESPRRCSDSEFEIDAEFGPWFIKTLLVSKHALESCTYVLTMVWTHSLHMN